MYITFLTTSCEILPCVTIPFSPKFLSSSTWIIARMLVALSISGLAIFLINLWAIGPRTVRFICRRGGTLEGWLSDLAVTWFSNPRIDLPPPTCTQFAASEPNFWFPPLVISFAKYIASSASLLATDATSPVIVASDVRFLLYFFCSFLLLRNSEAIRIHLYIVYLRIYVDLVLT